MMIDAHPHYAALIEDAGAAEARGDLDAALGIYDQAITLDPKAPAAWRGKAIALASALRYDDSLMVLSEAVRIASADDRLHGLLITNLREVGRKDEAFEAGQRAIGLAPRSPWVIKAVADTWRDRGAYMKALGLYDRGLELEPDNLMLLNGKATALFLQQDHAGAAWVYRRILALRPDDGLAWLNLAAAEEHQGHGREAHEAYEQALALRPGDADAAAGVARLADLAPSGRDFSYRTGIFGGPVTCHVTPEGAELRRASSGAVLRKVAFDQVTGGRWIEVGYGYYAQNVNRVLVLDTPQGRFRLVQRDGSHGGGSVPDLTPFYAACAAVLDALAARRPELVILQGYGQIMRWLMALVMVPGLVFAVLLAITAIFGGTEGGIFGAGFLVLCAIGFGTICVFALRVWNPLQRLPRHTPASLAAEMNRWIRERD
jgi:tetratricopeptide (TPR) repeat protein